MTQTDHTMRVVPVFLVLLLLMSACIGTDLVDEPLGNDANEWVARIDTPELSLLVGGQYLLTPSLLDGGGNPQQAVWAYSSQNENVVSVDADGLIEALAPGQTLVTAVANGEYADSVQINVTDDLNSVASVTIVVAIDELDIGQSVQLDAIARNLNGEPLNDKTISWSSDNVNVATVSDSGLVTAISPGEAGIRATAEGRSSLPLSITVLGGTDLRTGTFSGQNGYSVSGSATLEVTDDGATLRLESDFQAQSGPGLHVYLSPQGNSVNGGIELGELKSNSGAQNYTIPESADPAEYDFVIIHCKPFNVPFGSCELQ